MRRLGWLLAALLWPGLAMAGDLRVLTTGAYKGVLVAMQPLLEAQVGAHLVIENDTAGGVSRRIRAGERWDVVVLPPGDGNALSTMLGPMRALARVGIGVAVREGAAVPDVSTPDGVRAAVLGARAPAWIDPASGGSSGVYMARLWAGWGIAGELAPRAVLVRGGLVADVLRSGRADLAFQQMSELVGQPGVTVAGPLPPAIQNWTVYAGAVPSGSAEVGAANRLLGVLTGPDALAMLPRVGLAAP